MHIKEDIKGKLKEARKELWRLEEEAKNLDAQSDLYFELEKAVALWGSSMVNEYLKDIEENMTDERRKDLTSWA